MFNNVSMFQYVSLTIGTILAILWVLLYIFYCNRFENEIKALKKGEYFLSDIFFVGFGIIKLLKYNLNSAYAVKKTDIIATLKGRKYAQYYYFVFVGAKVTYCFTLSIVGFFLGAIANDTSVLLLFLFGIATIVFYMDYELQSKFKARKEEISSELPNVLCKLSLMINAGMTIRNAWKFISDSHTGVLYDEMKIVIDELKNGFNDKEALQRFSDRCSVKEVRKFSSMLIQNLQKGNSETAFMLKELSYESFRQKKMDVKIKSETAGQKLLFPMSIMLFAVLLIIIIPVFSSL